MTDSPTAPSQNPDIATGSIITAEQSASFVALLRKHGVSEDQIKEAVTGDGHVYVAPNADVSIPDRRTEDLKQFDAFAGPNTDPAAYKTSIFNLRGAPQTGDLATVLGATGPEFVPALEQAMRNGMAAMALPAQVGGSIIEMAGETAARFSRMSDAEKSQARQAARASVEQIFGPDATKDARELLNLWRTVSPDVVDALVAADYLSDARVLGALVSQAQRMNARDALGKVKK